MIRLTSAEYDLAGLQQLPTTEIGPAVRRTLHPVLDRAAEGDMHLPHLTAPKTRSCFGQDQMRRSVVEYSMINRPGARSQRHCRERRSVELDAMRRPVADRQEELERFQPVVRGVLVRDASTTTNQAVVGELNSEVKTQPIDGVMASMITVSAPTSVSPVVFASR